ncbi:MAG: hypothetical protein IT459_23110, partial [Planctomycetes bacterium]|nr:hypothetical protein [Planctomycetota bacterium]
VYLPKFDAQGKTSIPVPLPPLAALQDLSVYFQVVQPNFQAPGFYHLTMTNGLRWVLGT